MAYITKLTTNGAAKIAGGTLNITHMAVGDSNGVPYVPNGSETALSNEVYRAAISGLIQNSGQLSMQLIIPTTQGGWWIREAGVFDADGDLVFIANIPDREKAIGVTELTITLLATVSAAATINATVDTGAYITTDMLQNGLDSKVDKVTGKGLSTNDYTDTEADKLAGIEANATANEAATDAEAEAATDTDKFMTPETTYSAYGASDPVVLTTSPHSHDITESILTGAAAPMVINLADVTTYPKSKLNRIALTIANLSNKNWTIAPAVGGGALSETLSITGSTTTPPTYALDATSLPTVANGTIASNLFTATANNASAQTFDYVAGGTVESITPQMKFVPGTVLTVDPASTTGSTKFNYSASNTVQMGSKLLVDVAGTVSEITVAAGSQTSNTVFDSGWGLILFNSQGTTLWAIGANNRKTAYSTDNGNTWILGGTLSGSGTISSFNNIVSFSGALWLGVVNDTAQASSILYKSTDNGATWTTGYSQSIASAGSASCQIISSKLVVCFGYANIDNGGTYSYLLFYTTDGINFNACTPSSYASQDFQYQVSNPATVGNGRLCFSPERAQPFYTTDGINFNQLANIYIVGSRFSRWTYWDGAKFICSTGGTSGINRGIYTSTDGGAWIKRSADGINCYPLAYNGTVYAGVNHATNSAYYSSDALTWNTVTVTGATFRYFDFCTCNSVFFTGDNGANKQLMWQSNTTATSWTSSNLNAATYQFTMTSPSIAAPTWAALGGQAEQYSVSATSTPSFVAATIPAYTRSGNVITAMYAQVTGQSGTHVQLKALTLNSGDALSQIGATLEAGTLQTINGKTGLILAPGKVAMLTPTADGWLSDRDNVTGKVITTNYTMTAADDIVVLGANNLTATLPDATAVEPWKVYKVKAGDFTGGIIATQSGQTVDGTTPPTLNALDSLNVYSNGANWLID